MHFIPSTKEEKKDLLSASNVEIFSDLISIIPSHLRLDHELEIGAHDFGHNAVDDAVNKLLA